MSIEANQFGPEAPDAQGMVHVVDQNGEVIKVPSKEIEKYIQPDPYQWSEAMVVTFDREEDEGEQQWQQQ